VRTLLRGLAIGIPTWALLFLAAMAAFPFRASAPALFESVMTVALAIAATVTALFCLRRRYFAGGRDGLLFGVGAAATCVLIDAAMMLPGGPLEMTIGNYFADIGLSYLVIPLVYRGIAIAASQRTGP
jgi:hypothetical protein